MPIIDTPNNPPTTYVRAPPPRLAYMIAMAAPPANIGSSNSSWPMLRGTGSAISGGDSSTSSPRGSGGAV
jgi:hypothetical protein